MKKSGGILMKALFQLLLVVLVLVLGVGIFKILSSMRKPPARQEKPIVAPLVQAVTAHSEDLRMIVHGFGTAQPKVSVQIVPQVSGRVVASHPDFVAGGFFKAGEPLVRIEPEDYELAVENAAALVAQAEYMLQQEEAEALVARTEWRQLHGDEKPPSPLVLRLPQIKNANAQLQAAQSLLSRAKLDLERTAISMPFDGRVVTKNVDQGQYVTPGQPIATVYGTDVIEIIVPLEDKELEWFDAPLGIANGNPENDRADPAALVTAEFAGSAHTWKGTIVRTQGTIDAASRMVNVVAEIQKPFEQTNHGVPLTPGMFVNVEITGKLLTNVIRLPRYAIHNTDEVWLDRDGKLGVQKVKVVRRDKTHAYISSGIADGDIVIISPLDVVTDQMEIRTRPADSTDSDEEARQ